MRQTVEGRSAPGSQALRTMWRSPETWFGRGTNGGASSAVSMPSSSIADVTAGRAISVYYPAYHAPRPGESWVVRGFKQVQNNVLYDGALVENVYHPRMRFQMHRAHPTLGGPHTVVNATWAGHQQVFGASTWITSGATSATLTVASSAGFAIGDRVRIINAGAGDPKGIISDIPNATSIVLAGSVTTSTGQVVCAFHPLVPGYPTTSSAVETIYMLNEPLVIQDPTLDKFFLAIAIEHASSHATYNETAVQTWATPVDAIWYQINSGAGTCRTDAAWSGASLGSSISAMAFPADPQAGANLTAGGAGANIAQINVGIIWSPI